MKLSNQIRPISYLKTHAAEVVREMGKGQEPMIITQNGEAKVVLMDLASWERTRETMALLKILALGMRQVEDGRVSPVSEVVGRLTRRGSER